MNKGTVKSFKNGWGWVSYEEAGKWSDIFVHANECDHPPFVGAKVIFSIGHDKLGRQCAKNVCVEQADGQADQFRDLVVEINR